MYDNDVAFFGKDACKQMYATCVAVSPKPLIPWMYSITYLLCDDARVLFAGELDE